MVDAVVDAVVDPQPVISRLAGSKDSLLPSLVENPTLSPKISILGHSRTLGFFSPHRRIHPDTESTAPSFQDYLLLSGGGLGPGLKIYPDAKSTRTSSSSCEASESTLKSSVLSSPSTGEFPSESSDLGLKNGSCAAPLLKASPTPTIASREESNSISSFLSALVSALTATKNTRERHTERPSKHAMNSDEFMELPGMPTMRKARSMHFSGMSTGNGRPDSPLNVVQARFASPSFIRPQGRRLVARREPSPLIHSPSMESLQLQYSQSANLSTLDIRDEGIALSRIPIKDDVIPEEDETSEYDMAHYDQRPLSNHTDEHVPEHHQTPEFDHMPEHEIEEMQVQPQMPEQDKRISAEDLFGQGMAEQIDSIVSVAALDDNSKPEWRTYMENYSKGSFNISTPPAPPPMSATLQYLPSIFPCTEARRMSVFNSHRFSWNQVTADRLSHLLASVIDKFGLDCGAISFFNKKNEYIKAERGYNVQNISRSTSIAAHGLLSADVFVIPDTEKDWRFQNHPLVIGGPEIRFFAGAPLLGEGGQPIGMLSIFSGTCLPDFSPFDRRALADFAAEAMKDLTPESQSEHSLSGPPTPKLERNPVAGDSYPANNSYPTELENNDGRDLVPVPAPLRYYKSKTPLTTIVNKQTSQNDLLPGNYGSLPESSQGYQPGEFGVDDGTSLYKLDDLHIREFVPPSPRPFSSSDVSSIHKHPSNTPVHSQLGFPTAPGLDFSTELLRSLSSAEYAESTQEEYGESLMSSSKLTKLSPRKTAMRSPGPNMSPSSHAAIRKAVRFPVWPSENSALATPRPASREDARANAALICSRTAKRLSYDLVYAIELNRSLDVIDETRILEPGALPMSILAAYGMNKPFRPNPLIHLEALRSTGIFTWDAPRYIGEIPGGYRFGYMIAIPTQPGARHLRTSGIVIAAFKKQQPDVENAIGATDAEYLMNAGKEVKSLFWPTSDSSPRPSHEQSNTEPMSKPYPAHEAVRMGQFPPNLYHRHGPPHANSPRSSPSNLPTPNNNTQDYPSNGVTPATEKTAKFRFMPNVARYRQTGNYH